MALIIAPPIGQQGGKMGFRENLLKKIQIIQLAGQVRRSLKPADPPRRIDRSAMQTLLDMGPYTYRRERDLDLYCQGDTAAEKQFIIVLDNELKLYHTTIDDVVLRKSPTVKEMVSIRNAIKILNDKDVVVSSKTDTLQHLQDELVGALDLSYTDADLESLERDGRDALQNSYADGVQEILALFGELLEFEPAPKPFQLSHHHILGAVDRTMPGAVQMGPVILFGLMRNSLKMLRTPISNIDKAAMQHFVQVSKDEAKADVEGGAVFAELKKMVGESAPNV